MTLQNIIDIIIYGYSVKDEQNINIGWSLARKLKNPNNEIDIDKYDRVISFTYGDAPSQRQLMSPDTSFTLWETECVNSDGVTYNTPGRKYYFYSFSAFGSPSGIYQDDELDRLMKSIHKDICSRMKVQGLRNIKITNLLNANIHT